MVNLRFAEPPPSQPLENQKTGFAALFDFGRDDIVRLSELGALTIMTLLVLLLVVRPLVNKMFAPEQSLVLAGAGVGGAIVPIGIDGEGGNTGAGGTAGGAGGGGSAGGAGGTGVFGADGRTMPTIDATNPTNQRLDIAKALGAMQASSVVKMGEMITESPNEAALIIRTWLNEGT